MNNIVIVVQARLGSTRLPNKVLMPLSGKPLIIRMLERVSFSDMAHNVVVAVTNETDDDELVELCEAEGYSVFRGSTNDLLDRHYQTGLKYNAEDIVKIPSDCPLIDPDIITRVIDFYVLNKNTYDYVSNLHPATYPDGNDVEVMSMKVLYNAWNNSHKDFEREHTTPYLWENPDRFKIGNVEWETGQNFSMSHRWTIDYLEDYLFIKEVFDSLYESNPRFGLNDILEYERNHPEVKALNSKYNGVNWYRNHLNELKTIKPDQTKVI
jgi:spore coat polysaccharide biosynthesis protein SpsF